MSLKRAWLAASISLVVALVLFSVAIPAKASPITFTENFNTVPCGFGVTTLPNWTVGNADGVTNGNIDVLDVLTGCTSVIPPIDNRYVDLHGTSSGNMGNDNASLTTITTFGIGVYTLSFYLGNNGVMGVNGQAGDNNSLRVTLGSFSQTFGPLSGFQPFTLQTVTFTRLYLQVSAFARLGRFREN
jgi:hypothetical protein